MSSTSPTPCQLPLLRSESLSPGRKQQTEEALWHKTVDEFVFLMCHREPFLLVERLFFFGQLWSVTFRTYWCRGLQSHGGIVCSGQLNDVSVRLFPQHLIYLCKWPWYEYRYAIHISWFSCSWALSWLKPLCVQFLCNLNYSDGIIFCLQEKSWWKLCSSDDLKPPMSAFGMSCVLFQNRQIDSQADFTQLLYGCLLRCESLFQALF